MIPQPHKLGKVDLKTMVETHGQHLPGAIPVPAMPGDVVVIQTGLLRHRVRYVNAISLG